MPTCVVPEMAKKKATTKHVRVSKNLADKIGWIVEVEGGSSAEMLEPLIKSAVETRYAKIEKLVEEIKKRRQTSKAD